MSGRKVYAWQQDGKWHMSVLPKNVKLNGKRPANVYDTQQQVVEEAGRRGVQVEWESD